MNLTKQSNTARHLYKKMLGTTNKSLNQTKKSDKKTADNDCFKKFLFDVRAFSLRTIADHPLPCGPPDI